ncbi:MAG: NAD(P)H-hydrate epimerase, partial [bacterium]
MPECFYTETGKKVPAVTAEQMRAVDQIAVTETGPNLYQMMENAGRSLAELAVAVLGKGWQKANIVVLAGSGGNGGGGICAARHLANRNARVRLCLVNPNRLGEVPAFQRKTFRFAGGREIEASRLPGEGVDLIVDAMIGYGLKSALRRPTRELIGWANAVQATILALDVPSGVDSTSGATPGAFIHPNWTLTLALPKTGLLPERTGSLFLADLGIPAET